MAVTEPQELEELAAALSVTKAIKAGGARLLEAAQWTPVRKVGCRRAARDACRGQRPLSLAPLPRQLRTSRRLAHCAPPAPRRRKAAAGMLASQPPLSPRPLHPRPLGRAPLPPSCRWPQPARRRPGFAVSVAC
jgi:hypothetical protein